MFETQTESSYYNHALKPYFETPILALQPGFKLCTLRKCWVGCQIHSLGSCGVLADLVTFTQGWVNCFVWADYVEDWIFFF